MNITKDELEAVVDTLGLRQVLEMLSEICELKAEHLAYNWQDEAGERLWHRASLSIFNVADKLNSGL